MKGYLTILNFLLLFVCIFDPQNLLFGIKDLLFILMAGTYFISLTIRKKKIFFPRRTIQYVFTFTTLPIISIILYFILHDFRFAENYVGFNYLKSYLFLFITFILIDYRIPAIKQLLFVLNLLAILTIVINNLPISEALYNFGNKFGIYAIGYRKYGFLDYTYTYFHTSPLLVFSLSYYLWQFFKKKSWLNFIFISINVLALINSGTRNNILFCLLIIIAFIFLASKNRIRIVIIITLTLLTTYMVLSSQVLSSMFSSDDISNNLKISYLSDYAREIFNFPNILTGQGIGSSFYISNLNKYMSVTELTYLEIFRRFGVVLGSLTIFLMFYPLAWIMQRKEQLMWLAIAYFSYLVMSAFNPFFFSSNGMILLSIILAKTAYTIKSEKQFNN